MDETQPGSDVRERQLAGRRRVSPRFVVWRESFNSLVYWEVRDELLQITVFHWYGASGEKKARAVAEALERVTVDGDD